MKKRFSLLALALVCFVGVLVASRAGHTSTLITPNYELLVKANNGDVAGVRDLLNNGADPNTAPGPNDKGMTALMFAAWKGHSEIVRLLARAGANVNAVSQTGATPLIYAANAGSQESVRILLNHGARTNTRMRDGATPLFYGVKSNDPQLTNLLVAASSPAIINARQNNGDTALMRAVRLGNLNVIDRLLDGNPALEVKDGFGNTALMNAARLGRTRAIMRLLRKGANPNTPDDRGVTARTKAKIGRHRAAQQVLRAGGGRG